MSVTTRIVTLIATLATLAVGAPAALAGTTTVGDVPLTPSAGGANVNGFTQNVPVFQGDSGGGYVLTSPQTGTITSWSFLSGGVSHGNQFVLRVLRPADMTGTDWTAAGSSAAEAVGSQTGTDGVEGPFTTSLPIKAGDRIALEPITDGQMPIETGTVGVDGIRYFSGSVANGSTAAIDPGSAGDNGQIVAVQATVSYITNTSLPVVTGNPVLGQTLACSQGTWDTTPDAYAYQWLRDGVAVAGATASSYTLVDSDEGHAMACQVTASLATSSSAQATSAATDPVKPGPAPTPVNTKLPSISGTAQQFFTLTADPGLWQDGVSSFAYQWLRCATAAGDNCQPVAGANASTYLLSRDDIGSTMRVQVTAANGAGPAAPVVSAPTAVVERGVVTAHLAVTPNFSCVGVPTVLSGLGSVSPDGIKSYRISLVNLSAFGATEYQAGGLAIINGYFFKTGQFSMLSDDEGIAERTYAVYNEPFVKLQFDWDRVDQDFSNTLVRDPVGIELDVTDYDGATAVDREVLGFGNQYELQYSPATNFGVTPSYTCPKGAVGSSVITAASLASRVLSIIGTAKHQGVSTPIACAAKVTCTTGITVATSKLVLCKACLRAAAAEAKRPKAIVLAQGVFTVGAHRKRTVRAPLTRQGRRALKLLRHGGGVQVTVTLTTVGATGKPVTRHYSEVLRGAVVLVRHSPVVS